MDDKKLYDLCRKYKYFYSAVRELKKVDAKYWNRHLRLALQDAEDTLDEVRDEMIATILAPYLKDMSVDIEHFPAMFGYHCYSRNGAYTTTIVGKEFADLIRNVLIRNHGVWDEVQSM